MRERKILAQRGISEVETKLEALREYDRVVEIAKEQNEVLFREEREAKIRNHEEIRRYEQAHLENMATRDPFKTKISAMSLSKAKSTLNSMKHTNVTAKEDIILPPSKYVDMREPIIAEKPERLES